MSASIQPKIFISYRHDDWPVKPPLGDDLRNRLEVDVFIDYDVDNDDFETSILGHLRESDAMLLIVTTRTFALDRIQKDDDWVRKEIRIALEQAIPLVPVCINGIRLPDELPADIKGLERKHRINIYQEDYNSGVGRLAELITKILYREDRSNRTKSMMKLGSSSNNAQKREQLLKIMLDPNIPPPDRAEAGREINQYGDPRPGIGLRPDGLPDIVWCEVPAGEFTMGSEMYDDEKPIRRVNLPKFYVAKYPITYKQFDAFNHANDGFEDERWWKGLAVEFWRLKEQSWQFDNHPRENVSWYEAIAFCRWMTAKLGHTISLPTEQQWEKAARNTDEREYPWGSAYVSGYANIDETEQRVGLYYIRQTTAVGIYPMGASSFDVMDMSGNVREWCLNEYENPTNTGTTGKSWRSLRGGSWNDNWNFARAANRKKNNPRVQSNQFGFRIVSEAPIP